MKTYKDVIMRMAEIVENADDDEDNLINEDQQHKLCGILFNTDPVYSGLEAMLKGSDPLPRFVVIEQCKLLKSQLDEMIKSLK